MDSLSPVVLLLVSFPEALLVAMLGLSLLGIRPTAVQVLFIGLIEAILGSLIRLLPFPFGVHTLLQFITFSAIIYFVTTIPFRVSFLVSLLGLSLYGVIEAVMVPMLFALSGMEFSEVFNNSWLRLAFFAPEAIVLVLLILLVRRFDGTIARYRDLIVKVEPNKMISAGTSFPIIGLFLVQSLLIAILFSTSYAAADSGRYPFPKGFVSVSVLYISVILILSVVMAISIKRIFTLIQNETKARAELDSLRHVEELVNTIRAQRHDFSNHLQVSYGLLEVGAYDEAKEYIGANVVEIKKNLELVKTDNLGVTALLFTKTGLAEARGVDFTVRVGSNLNPLPMESMDTNTIIGNLIDNAFEAVADLPAAQRRVEVALARDKDFITFEITNAGPAIDEKLLRDIFRPGVSTKGDGRGMGLYSAKKLVESYAGSISVTNKQGRVMFAVRVPLKN